ncbi:MAG: BMP family lipoprotein [Nocardioidaceae bacterium]
MKKTAKAMALIGVIALGSTACASKPSDDNASDNESTAPTTGGTSSAPATNNASNAKFKACMVSDSGGFDDKSFNQTSYKGLTDAVAKLGISKAQIESHTDSDYKDNVNAMISQHCNIIVTVGFKLAKVTLKAAKSHPKIDFAIVDNAYKPGEAPSNLKSLTFNTAQSSYLAGYLAAGMTKSGIVGTFGGLNIPTVTIYMDGFEEGVNAYKAKHDKSVKVVGWDEKSQDGLFTQDFEDKNKGQVTSENLVAQGADILFPVAGPAGLGALQTAKNSGGDVNAIWVDTDGCVSVPEYCSILMTSVFKGMDVAVEAAIEKSLKGNMTNEPYIGTLANGGTGLADFHQFDSKVPSDLKSEVDKLKQQIIDGKITIKSKAQPK